MNRFNSTEITYCKRSRFCSPSVFKDAVHYEIEISEWLANVGSEGVDYELLFKVIDDGDLGGIITIGSIAFREPTSEVAFKLKFPCRVYLDEQV